MCSTHGSAEMHAEFRCVNLEGSNYFEDVAVSGKIILKQNLNFEWNYVHWIHAVYLRVRTGGGLVYILY